MTQRLDGFVSLDAGEDVGTVVTRPLVFEGQHLELNVAARGAVRVGLLDETGRPLPGLALEDCDPITADSTRQTVSWGGQSDIGPHAGKVVQVQLRLHNAKVFALQFGAE